MSPATAILTGQHVRLWPYLRGSYPRDMLGKLWALMEQEQGADRLFYAQPIDPTPISTRGDLTSFVRYFDDDKRLLFLVEHLRREAYVGFFWFDDFSGQRRAAVNIFMQRRAWGHPAREVTALGCRYGFDVLGLASIWAYTPWEPAVQHALASGFTEVATLPEFGDLDGQPLDIHILRRRKDDGPHE